MNRNEKILADFKKMLLMSGMKGRERLNLIRGMKQILNAQESEPEVCFNCGFVYVDGVEYIPPEADDWRKEITKRMWGKFLADVSLYDVMFSDWLDKGGN